MEAKTNLGAQVEHAYLVGMLSLFRKTPAPTVPFASPLSPEESFYVIGDIHGALPKLSSLLKRLNEDDTSLKVVCVGDYIDRGDDSAGVIDLLRRRQTDAPDRLICLMGNHERMMLDFLDAPERSGAQWLRYGGKQTLASFRIAAPGKDLHPAEWRDLAADLRAALGHQAETWLRRLPLHWQSGNVAVVHAAADPALSIQDQPEEALLWGHPDFIRTPRRDGIWVVHGHTIVPDPVSEAGRIAVDTGAFATGRLSAAQIASGGVRFVTV